MNKSSVFIGPVDVANNGAMFKKALSSAGIRCDYYSYSNAENYFNYKKDRTLFQIQRIPRIFNKNITQVVNNFIKFFHLLYLLFRYDTFIFNLPHTLLPGNKDLPILKFFGKKIVTTLSGCPDREVNMYPNDPEYICNRCNDEAKKKICLCLDLPKKKDRVQDFERHSAFLIAQSDSTGYLSKKKFVWYYVISESPLKTNYLKKFDSEEIVITHFPSNPLIKLSHIIIPVLEEIAKERPKVKLIIKTKIPHQEVLEHLEETHILVDALGLSYGVLGVEGMARGCVSIVGDMPFINEKLKDHPLVASTSMNLKESILKLVDNKELLKEYARRSIKFYNDHHSVESAGMYYKEQLNLK